MSPTNEGGGEPQNPAGRAALLGRLRIDAAERDAPRSGLRPWQRWPVRIGVLLLLVTLAVVAWWNLRGPSFEVELATAVVASPAQGPAAVLQASGYVTARRQATVSAQITGTLREVLIEEGEHVQAGQVLARLDDSALQAGVQQAHAQLASAQAVAVQIQAQLTQAERDAQRNQDLINRQLVSRQALEASQTQQAAQARQAELAEALHLSKQVDLMHDSLRAQHIE